MTTLTTTLDTIETNEGAILFTVSYDGDSSMFSLTATDLMEPVTGTQAFRNLEAGQYWAYAMYLEHVHQG